MNDQSQKNNPTSLDERLGALHVGQPDKLYFAITLTADDSGKIIFETPTEWAGWSDEKKLEELRRARLVYAQYAEIWKLLGQPYLIVHTPDDMMRLLVGGGNALVEEEMGRKIFAGVLGAERSIRRGVGGFISPELLPQTVFRRIPTPKIRMQVLKRDRYRCRICGRGPDDHLDIVLHVHHIRPWQKGGITDPANLITLCHTCHTGLDPHDEPDLFNYLRPDDPMEERLRQYRKGVANYRRIGFLGGTHEEQPPRRRRRLTPQEQ
jgi:hypothetical protein